jgi:hypothetical protein
METSGLSLPHCKNQIDAVTGFPRYYQTVRSTGGCFHRLSMTKSK